MARSKLPQRIDFLDLFCGDGRRVLELAERHPKKVFVGVDIRKSMLPAKMPGNVFFVAQDALEFLRNRRQAGSVRHVNIDYGLHFLPVKKRRELYSHVGQLLAPRGRVHLTVYDNGTGVTPRLAEEELANAGFTRTLKTPLRVAKNGSSSMHTAIHSAQWKLGIEPSARMAFAKRSG